MNIRKRRTSGSVTISDVASLAGVGTMTVSRALRTPEAVSDKLLEKVQVAIKKLGYIPNQAAGALASGQIKTIIIIVPSLKDKFCSEFLHGFQLLLNKQGYDIHISYSHNSLDKEEQLIESALGLKPSAILIFGQSHTNKAYQLLENASCPTLQIGSLNNPKFTLNLGLDHFKLTLEATEYLLQTGRMNIGFIGAKNDPLTLQQQLKGWQSALINAYQSPDHFLTSHQMPGLKLGIEGLTRLLLRESKIDALICSHEEIALGVLFECQNRHIKVPEDLNILCLDAGEICEHSHPKITSIDINYSLLAKDAAQLIISSIHNVELPILSNEYYKLNK